MSKNNELRQNAATDEKRFENLNLEHLPCVSSSFTQQGKSLGTNRGKSGARECNGHPTVLQ